MDKVVRFIEYRRAAWFSEDGVVEDYFRELWSRKSLSSQRIYVKPDGSAFMANAVMDFGANGIGLQIVRYIDGQPVGVVPMTDTPNTQLSEKRPGNAENYLDNAVFALIKKNHVLTINAGQNGAALRVYLHGMFQNADLGEDATKFDLVRIASVDKIRKIHAAGGVDRVQLDLSIEEATASYLDDEARSLTANGIRSTMASVIGYIVASDHKAAKIANSTKGKVRMTLNVPASDRITAKEGLDAVAEVMVEDEDSDSYVIKLRNGDTITPSEISAKKRVRVERYANTLSLEDVMVELKVYMEELRVSGQLEA